MGHPGCAWACVLEDTLRAACCWLQAHDKLQSVHWRLCTHTGLQCGKPCSPAIVVSHSPDQNSTSDIVISSPAMMLTLLFQIMTGAQPGQHDHWGQTTVGRQSAPNTTPACKQRMRRAASPASAAQENHSSMTAGGRSSLQLTAQPTTGLAGRPRCDFAGWLKKSSTVCVCPQELCTAGHQRTEQRP